MLISRTVSIRVFQWESLRSYMKVFDSFWVAFYERWEGMDLVSFSCLQKRFPRAVCQSVWSALFVSLFLWRMLLRAWQEAGCCHCLVFSSWITVLRLLFLCPYPVAFVPVALECSLRSSRWSLFLLRVAPALQGLRTNLGIVFWILMGLKGSVSNVLPFNIRTAFSTPSFFNFTSALFLLCRAGQLSPSLLPSSTAFYCHILPCRGLLQPDPPSPRAGSWQTHLKCVFFCIYFPLEQYYNAKDFVATLPYLWPLFFTNSLWSCDRWCELIAKIRDWCVRFRIYAHMLEVKTVK